MLKILNYLEDNWRILQRVDLEKLMQILFDDNLSISLNN